MGQTLPTPRLFAGNQAVLRVGSVLCFERQSEQNCESEGFQADLLYLGFASKAKLVQF